MMKRNIVQLIEVILIFLTLPAFSLGSSTHVQIPIGDYAYVPEEISIEPGTTVEWKNEGKIEHFVTSKMVTQSGFPLFASYAIKPTLAWYRQFDQSGIYEYYCPIHPQMTGRVVVKEGADKTESRG